MLHMFIKFMSLNRSTWLGERVREIPVIQFFTWIAIYVIEFSNSEPSNINFFQLQRTHNHRMSANKNQCNYVCALVRFSFFALMSIFFYAATKMRKKYPTGFHLHKTAWRLIGCLWVAQSSSSTLSLSMIKSSNFTNETFIDGRAWDEAFCCSFRHANISRWLL